uniref:hypothetical protein n=1 Tax=Gemmiger formicilis TaxID=745368 RepID=UPI003FEF8970
MAGLGHRADSAISSISYHREVPRGESFTLRRARPAEDTFYFEGEREGKSAFEAQLIFKHL